VRFAVGLAALALAPAALPSSTGYGAPRQVGTITATELSEVSGMTPATVVPGRWWVVNDSGNTPDLHLIDARGKLLASVRVSGVANVDWEDLASVPGPDGRRILYVGDIGDNDEVRDDLVVYRVPEPSSGQGAVAPTAFPFRYPDGRHNAEALFADPASGRIFVLTKTQAPRSEPCRLYRFPLPLDPGRRVTLERVGGRFATLVAPLPLVTGAAVSSDGTRLAIRTYGEALEWRRRPGSAFAALLAADPERISLARERQGESIAYSRDGKALATTSERLPAPIWRMARR
jgi:hypothetical protein